MKSHARLRRGSVVLAGTSLAVLMVSACSFTTGSAPLAPVSVSPARQTALSTHRARLPVSPGAEGSNPPGPPAAPSAPASSTTVQGATPSGTPVTQRRPGWALDRIDQRKRPLDSRYTVRRQGKGVTVYVVDGVFDVKNAELGGRASVGLRSGKGCVLEDGIDHGLFVAGIVGGRRTGVAKQARIVSVGAISGCEGRAGDSQAQRSARLVRALKWVAANARRPAVVNLSLNVEAPSPTVAAAVRRVVGAGLTVVAAAGNNGEDACRYPPAGLPSVVTVAAATRKDRDAGLNHGRCVDLFAPAEGVTSVVDPGLDPDRLVRSDGAATSWAAPFVSGAAALYLSGHPSATPDKVRRWLIRSATRGALRGELHGSANRLLYVGGV